MCKYQNTWLRRHADMFRTLKALCNARSWFNSSVELQYLVVSTVLNMLISTHEYLTFMCTNFTLTDKMQVRT